MNSRPRLLLLCLLWLLPAASAWAGLWDEPYIETIDDQDAIPDDNVTALAEDRQGFIWIGTPNGLLRYDGYRFKRYVNDRNEPDSIGGGFVRALLVAADGRLWVGSNAQGVSIYDPVNDRFSHLRQGVGTGGLPDDGVRALAQTRDGAVWIATLGGLSRWDPGSGRVTHFPADGSEHGPADDRVLGLAVDGQGNLWVGSWRGLDRLRPGGNRFERMPLRALLGTAEEPSIRGLVPSADGGLWIGTLDAAILRRDPSGAGYQRLRLRSGDGGEQPSDMTLLAGAELADGQQWLAGLGGGIICEAGQTVCSRRLQFDSSFPSGLGSADIRAILKDRAGQLWIGGYSSGLQRINAGNRALRMLRYRPLDPNGLGDASISAVHVGSDGLIYLGTRGHGIDVLHPQRGVIERIRPQPDGGNGLSNGVVTALTGSPDGRLWAGTDFGLGQIGRSGQPGRHYLRADGLPSNTIRRLFFDQQDRLWVCTNAGLAVLAPKTTRFQVITDEQGRAIQEDINAIVQARDGRFWVGSIRGLYSIAPGTASLRRMVANGGTGVALGDASVLGLLLDRDGVLWVDTPEGLYRRFDGDERRVRFESISGRHAVAGQPFGANLLQDRQGRIWSQKFVYDPARRRIDELLRADGADLGTGWFRAFDRDGQGRFYFGGSKGLLRIEPELFQPWDYAPPLVITEVTLDGRHPPRRDDAAPVLVANDVDNVSVEFSALDYSAPARLKYQYRLVGFDRDWIDSDPARRLASYNRLWPGEYRLRVRGSNRSGDWSEHELSLPIRVLPKFWQTPAFLLLLLLLLGSTLWLASRWYSRGLRRRAELLRALVATRTGELSQAKDSAEQAVVDLHDTQQQLIASEKMAALGRLVAGVAHELNTPLGIAITAASVIAARGRQLRRSLVDNSLKKSELQQYIDTTTEAGELVEGSLERAAQLVQTFKQVAGDSGIDERRRFELQDFLQSMCRGLAGSWQARGIRHTLECPSGILLDSYAGTLGQVVLALSDNALHHAFEGRDGGYLRLHAREDGRHVQIEFSDDGVGIAAHQVARIFEPFFTSQRARGRTGLGLHIVYNQVTARLGGTVTVTSVLEQGTRFELRIPLVAPA